MQDETVGHGTQYLYEMFTRNERIVFVAGQIPKSGPDSVLRPGICGVEHDVNSARDSARVAARQAIHWIEQAMEENERIDRVLRLGIFVALSDEFVEMSEVADAASEVFIDRFGDCGRHARSVLGVRKLPRNAPVLVEATICLGRH